MDTSLRRPILLVSPACILALLASQGSATLNISGYADSASGGTILSDSFAQTSDTAGSLNGSLPLDYSGGQAGAAVTYGGIRLGAIGNL